MYPFSKVPQNFDNAGDGSKNVNTTCVTCDGIENWFDHSKRLKAKPLQHTFVICIRGADVRTLP